MGLNLNDAPEQMAFGIIPDGTFVKVILVMKAGGYTLPNQAPADANLFKQSTKPGSDVVMIDCELIIEGGDFNGRKIFENLVVDGGARDQKGASKGWNMTKSRMRAMVESALAISPKDESPEAKAKRDLPSFSALHNCPFWVKLTVEPGEAYVEQATGITKPGRDKNVVERIVVPTDTEYNDLRSGKSVAAKPSGLYRPSTAAPAAAAAAAPTAAWASPPPPPAAAAPPATGWVAPGAPAPAAAAAEPAALPGWAQR